VIFEKLLSDFAQYFPEDGAERETLRLALHDVDIERFAERLRKHDSLHRRAERGDADAALHYFDAARRELIEMLRERGHDATVFIQSHWSYRGE